MTFAPKAFFTPLNSMIGSATADEPSRGPTSARRGLDAVDLELDRVAAAPGVAPEAPDDVDARARDPRGEGAELEAEAAELALAPSDGKRDLELEVALHLAGRDDAR